MEGDELKPLLVIDERDFALENLLDDISELRLPSNRMAFRKHSSTPFDIEALRTRVLRAAWFVEDVLRDEVQLRPQVLDPNKINLCLAHLQRYFMKSIATMCIYGLILLSFLEMPGWMTSTSDWELYPTYFSTWLYLDFAILMPIEGTLLSLFAICFISKVYLIKGQLFNRTEPFLLRLPLYIEMTCLAGAIIEFLMIIFLQSFSYTRVGHVFRICIFCARHPRLFNAWVLILRLIPCVLNVIFLVVFFLFFSSWCFWWIFIVAPGVGTEAFHTIHSSYYNLFQLLTTNNFPSVMMPFYDANSTNSLLFMAFVVVGVFFLLNLVLSVVFFNYQELNSKLIATNDELTKKNIETAFRLLDITGSDRIGVEEMVLLLERMDIFRRLGLMQGARVQKILYRLKKKDAPGEFIDLGEFEGMILVLAAEFENIGPQSFMEVQYPEIYYMRCFQRLVRFVRGNEKPSVIFEEYGSERSPESSTSGEEKDPPMAFFVDLVILLHLFFLLAAVIDPNTQEHAAFYEIVENIFIEIYMLELLLKLFILGPSYYWHLVRNRIDGALIITVFVALHLQLLNAEFFHWMNVPSIQSFRVLQSMVSLRTVKLFRHLKMAPFFWGIMSSVDLVISSSGTLLMVLFSFMYFSGTFGVSLLGGAVCKARTLDDGSVFCADNNGIPADSAYARDDYFNNNFNDLPSALTVIFEVFVQNDIWVICEGLSFASGKFAATRAYFIFNYIVGTIILLNIVVAVIITSTMEVFSSQEKRRSSVLHDGAEIPFIGSTRHRLATQEIGASPNLARELAFEFDQVELPEYKRTLTHESLGSYIHGEGSESGEVLYTEI